MQIGRYEVIAVLGHGAFGEVLHARLNGPQGFRKDVAIKRLEAGEDPEKIEEDMGDVLGEAMGGMDEEGMGGMGGGPYSRDEGLYDY